jgi:hypothetical protein
MFKEFSRLVHDRFVELSKGELFATSVENFFEQYLESFPEGTNEIFRERTHHDCNCCKHFIRRVGHLVGIERGQLVTVWDDAVKLTNFYGVVARAMRSIVLNSAINGVFRTKERAYSTEYNYDSQTSQRWDHFYARIADKHWSATPQEAAGELNTNAATLKRALNELTIDSLTTILNLINEKQIYRGEEHKQSVKKFLETLRAYQECNDKDIFIWSRINDFGSCRFRNSVIGTLADDLSKGVDTERAVKSFETKVAPANYKRPTSVITPKMVADALAKLQELGLEHAVNRRFAKLSDLSVNNVLFAGRRASSVMQHASPMAQLMEETRRGAGRVNNPMTISIEDFYANILPKSKSIELYLEGRHLSNFVSLTAPIEPSEKQLFKWDNEFAWSYDGEVTDSIKERVKSAGGKIDAYFRVSLAWSNADDLDIHARGPMGQHIYFSNPKHILDVDTNGMGTHNAINPVENLAFRKGDLRDGTLHIDVHQYNKRRSDKFGFTIETEYEGQINQYSYPKAMSTNENIRCLSITVRDGQIVNIRPSEALTGGSITQEKWGLKTNSLIPVDTIMLSPNHWDGNGIGNRHWFFILEGCKNPEPVRGIYNEFLNNELERNRKVFEILGSKTKCQYSDEQLSGLGFSSTREDSVILVADNKSYKVEF